MTTHLGLRSVVDSEEDGRPASFVWGPEAAHDTVYESLKTCPKLKVMLAVR